MSAAPWTYIGWALLALLGIGAVVALIGSVVAFAQARRFQRQWREADRYRREVRAEIRWGDRPRSGRFKP